MLAKNTGFRPIQRICSDFTPVHFGNQEAAAYGFDQIFTRLPIDLRAHDQISPVPHRSDALGRG